MRDAELLARAKAMRLGQTTPEQLLWSALRANRCDGAKFRRQVVIGPFIADFACRTPRKIVVEVDGPSHDQSYTRDGRRSAFLAGQGYSVLRFSNGDVLSNLDGLVSTIREALRTPPLPNPLP